MLVKVGAEATVKVTALLVLPPVVAVILFAPVVAFDAMTRLAVI